VTHHGHDDRGAVGISSAHGRFCAQRIHADADVEGEIEEITLVSLAELLTTIEEPGVDDCEHCGCEFMTGGEPENCIITTITKSGITQEPGYYKGDSACTNERCSKMETRD